MTDVHNIITQEPTNNQPSIRVIHTQPAVTEKITLAELHRRQEADRIEEQQFTELEPAAWLNGIELAVTDPLLQQRNQHLAELETATNCCYTTIRPNSKAPESNNWQHTPMSADNVAHWQHGIGLLCGKHSDDIILIDLDSDAKSFIDQHPQLKNTLTIWREDADGIVTDRVKIAVRVTDYLPSKQAHKYKIVRNGKETLFPDTYDTDIISTGGQGIIWGPHPEGGRYVTNWQTEIIEMSFDELDQLWQERTGKALKRAGESPTKPARAKSKQTNTSPDYAININNNDSSPITQAKNLWLCADVFSHFNLGEQSQESGGTRFLGNGGLIANGRAWYCHAEQTGGNAIDAWHYAKTGEAVSDGRLAYQIALEMLAVRGVNVHTTKPANQNVNVDAQLDYLASFDIDVDGLLRTALGAIKCFELAVSDITTLSYRSIAPRAGISKSDVEKYLFLLSPEMRDRRLESLQWQLIQASDAASIVDDNSDIHYLMDNLPKFYAEPLREKWNLLMEKLIDFGDKLTQTDIDTHTAKIEQLRTSTIKSIEKRVTKLSVNISRIENYDGPDLLKLVKSSDCGGTVYQLIARDCGQYAGSTSTSKDCPQSRAISYMYDHMDRDALVRNIPSNEIRPRVIRDADGKPITVGGVSRLLNSEPAERRKRGRLDRHTTNQLDRNLERARIQDMERGDKPDNDPMILELRKTNPVLESYGSTGLRIIAHLLAAAGEVIQQSDLATAIGKHNNTVRVAINRMLIIPDSQHIGDVLSPIINVDDSGRSKLISLADDWIERLDRLTIYMTTYQINYKREVQYTREAIAEIDRKLQMILTDEGQVKLQELRAYFVRKLNDFGRCSEPVASVEVEPVAVIEPVASVEVEPVAVIEPVASVEVEPVAVIEPEVICTRKSFVVDADGLYAALSKLTDSYKADTIKNFFFGWGRTSKRIIAEIANDLGLSGFIKMELMQA